MILPKRYYATNLKLAYPIILSLLCQSFVQVADTLMVGRLNALSLAAVSFSGAIINVALVLGIGIAIAITPLISQCFAQGKHKKIADFLANGLVINGVLSLVLVAVLIALIPFLSYFGQSKDVIVAAKPYYIIMALSLIPNQIFLCFKQFLEGLQNTKVAMTIIISANILNIFLNSIFIYGLCGFPQMGVFGAGLASFIARLLTPIALFIYIRYHKTFCKYLKLIDLKNINRIVSRSILRIGVPICGQMTIECFAFGFITFYFGWVSVTDIAAYQVVMTMVTMTFHICIGLANATTILVGYHLGKGNWQEISRFSKTGLHLALVFMSCSMLCFVLGGELISSAFSTDKAVIALASKLFIVAGMFQLLDGSQATLLGALRGLKAVKRPMYYAFASYIFIALPVAYVLCFVFSLPSWSILAGLSFGMLVVTLLYYRELSRILRLH
ncbi:MAG: MATE family efflux transporter [Bacteroidales bacterium]|jgi:MATE family multidrug resistance protein|nr:MATE family efflux transporter [Bacteroidales bacterium]